MRGLSTISGCSQEVRADVAAARDRDPAAQRRLARSRSSSAGPGCRRCSPTASPTRCTRPACRWCRAAIAYVTRAVTGVEIHPAAQDRRRVLHRPRLRRGDRRDGRDRRPGDALPGGDPGRHRLPARQAPPDPRATTSRRLRRQAARPDRGRRTAPRSAPTRSSSRTCRRARPSSATPATRCGSRARRSRAPTPTGSTCRTRSPTRSRRSRSGSRELERRLAELDGGEQRRAPRSGELRPAAPGRSSAGG